MLYRDFIRKRGRKSCPFCKLENRILVSRPRAFLTYAIAPYSKYHLLVIPKRHVISFLKLNPDEEKDIEKLLDTGARMLRKLGIDDWTILVRNGNGNRQKSVDHLHYHIIPNHRIGDLDQRGRPRRVLTEKETDRLVGKLKSLPVK